MFSNKYQLSEHLGIGMENHSNIKLEGYQIWVFFFSNQCCPWFPISDTKLVDVGFKFFTFNVLSWTWNLEQRLFFRCDLSPSNCLVCRRKAFTEKFGDKSCAVRECQIGHSNPVVATSCAAGKLSCFFRPNIKKREHFGKKPVHTLSLPLLPFLADLVGCFCAMYIISWNKHRHLKRLLKPFS